jgi:predicted nuclease of restriction endonuclease-like (RecB) superfamily
MTKIRQVSPKSEYAGVLTGIVDLLQSARRAAARSVNAVMTATYWEIGRRIVEFEQGGRRRADYGQELMETLSAELAQRFGRGFSLPNLHRFRQFYIAYPPRRILSTVSRKFKTTGKQPPSVTALAAAFPLPWSHYVRLLSLHSELARRFYEEEAFRGGWSIRQLDRQIGSQFYERTALSRNKAAMLKRGSKSITQDKITPEQEVKDPLVLEFLGLKDEYSESDLEESLIRSLETFLLELGNDFAFIGRQRRLRIDDEWYRVDLLLFHRRLRCLVLIDLKLDRFTHADAGQMNLYLNYARHHWTGPGENPPVGIVLCAAKGQSLVHYATENLPNKMLVREYRTALPDEKILARQIQNTRRRIEGGK